MKLNIQLFGGRGASSFNNKNSINTISYEAMMRYVNTGRDSDFKDYIQLSNGNIIARAKKWYLLCYRWRNIYSGRRKNTYKWEIYAI